MLILTYQDILNLEIDLIPFIILNMMLIQTGFNLKGGIICFIIWNIIYLYNQNLIAYADIILLTTCSYNLNLNTQGFFYLITSITASIYGLYQQKNKIPLIPFITISFFIFNQTIFQMFNVSKQIF